MGNSKTIKITKSTAEILFDHRFFLITNRLNMLCKIG